MLHRVYFKQEYASMLYDLITYMLNSIGGIQKK